MCYHDPMLGSKVQETLERMLDSKMEELEELRAVHVSLSSRCNFAESSHRRVEDKSLKVIQTLLERRKTLKAVRTNKDELTYVSYQQQLELSRDWQVRDEVWHHEFFSNRKALRI